MGTTWVSIGDVCHIEKGNIGITKAIEGVYPLVTLGEERRTHNEYQFDDEAVIIPLVSSTGHGHRSMKRIHYQTGKFAIGSILCALIPKDKTKVLAQYLFRYLDFNKEKELVSRMKGMANVSLSIKSISEVEIPLPSIATQRTLLQKFDTIEVSHQKLANEQVYQLDLLKKLRQQILQDAVQGKLVPQDLNDEPANKLFKRIRNEKEKLIKEKKIRKEKPLPEIKSDEIPFVIPKNWAWCRLGDICAKIGSGSTPNGSNYSNIGIPFFRSQNILDNGLAFDDIKYISNDVHKQMDGTVVYPLDLLLNITGGSLGRCAIVPSDFQEGNVSQHVCIIRPIILSNTYLHRVVLSPFFQKMIFGSTTGAGREGLPKYNLEQFLIPIPPLPEQQRIVTKIEQLITLCNELEQTIQQSQKYIKDLLQVALKEALEPSASLPYYVSK